MQVAGPQDLLKPPSDAAIFLVLTVESGCEAELRDVLTDVSGLRRSVGFRAPESGLTCVVGIASGLWDRLFGEPRPSYLHPLPEFAGSCTPPSRRPATCCSTSVRIVSTCASSSPSG